MKLIMIGTPVCPKCKALAPKVEEYCKEHDIEYTYMYINDAPSDVLNLIKSSGITTAPLAIVDGASDGMFEDMLYVIDSEKIKENFSK